MLGGREVRSVLEIRRAIGFRRSSLGFARVGFHGQTAPGKLIVGAVLRRTLNTKTVSPVGIPLALPLPCCGVVTAEATVQLEVTGAF